jgi:hypothetical protein
VVLTSGAQKQESTEAAPFGRKSVIVALVPIASISQLWGVTLQPGEWKDAEVVSASIRITGGQFSPYSASAYQNRAHCAD